MLEFLIAFALFLSFATMGALCGVAVWLMKLEDRITLLEDPRSRERCNPGNPYLWASPLIDGERDYE